MTRERRVLLDYVFVAVAVVVCFIGIVWMLAAPTPPRPEVRGTKALLATTPRTSTTTSVVQGPTFPLPQMVESPQLLPSPRPVRAAEEQEPEVAPQPPAEEPAPVYSDDEGYVCTVFDDCDFALTVMGCEGGAASSTNGSHWGHWQINVNIHRAMILDWADFFGLPHSVESVRDIRVGTQIAYSLSHQGTNWYDHFSASAGCWS